MAPELVLIRGGGDLATGVAWRLTRAGWPVIVTELAHPLTVRRTVALSSAVRDGEVSVEGMIGKVADDADHAVRIAQAGDVAVLVSPSLPNLAPEVIVDARLAKRNIDTTTDDASLVIGLGPGFSAGSDCHAVVETMRGPRLGRVLWDGAAEPNTGTPGIVGGRSAERVLRAPCDGVATWATNIGDPVQEADMLGAVGGQSIVAPFDGVIRGLIYPDTPVHKGLKIGDIDPRSDAAAHKISDKALSIGGGVVEAVHTWLTR